VRFVVVGFSETEVFVADHSGVTSTKKLLELLARDDGEQRQVVGARLAALGSGSSLGREDGPVHQPGTGGSACARPLMLTPPPETGVLEGL
jgi:hypothetical protein